MRTCECSGLLCALAVTWAAMSYAQAEGDSKMESYRDERTGVRLRNLTPECAKAQLMYQTHPMWTPNMEYLVFDAEKDGVMLPHALLFKTGHTRPIVDTPVPASVLDRKTGRFYYIQDNDIMAINVGLAFRRMAKPRRIAAIPSGLVKSVCGGLSLDTKGDWLYMGVENKSITPPLPGEDGKHWAILYLDIESAQWHKVVDLDFKVGHVQANPTIARVIMFCHETGGDAPQRIWMVNASGKGLRPFFEEKHNEWVTHETWWGGTRVLFTIWPYDDEHKKLMHGIVSADVAVARPTPYAQYPAWHAHGSPNGQWVLGDDFDRNIWLVKADTKERRLLTQGHLGKGFNTHPHASFTPDNKAVVFNSSRTGAESIFLAELPEWDSLPGMEP